MLKRIDYRILTALWAHNPDRGISGWELIRQLKVSPTTVYASLERLQKKCYVEARWQGDSWPSGEASQDEQSTADQPRWRYYRLTPTGRHVYTKWTRSQGS